MCLVHIFIAYYFHIPFNNIHALTLCYSSGIFLLRLYQTCIRVSLMHTLYFARLNLFYLSQNFGSVVLIFSLYFINICKLFQKILGLTDMWV